MIYISSIPTLAIDPLLPIGIIGLLAVGALIAAIAAGIGRLKSAVLRALAGLVIVLALLDPQTVEEERDALQDVVLLLKDQSDSVGIGKRAGALEKANSALAAKLSEDPTLEVVEAIIPSDRDGTRLTSHLVEALGNVPAGRLAGVIAITDGQIHDLPEAPEALMPEGVPFHALIIGDPDTRDRRIRAIVAPRYGLVEQFAEFQVRVDDPGHEGERASIAIKLNGELQARFNAIIGDNVSIPLEIERRGINTVELTVEAVPGELTLNNNVFVAELSGIRDRLRVLLVTGNPHNGGRAWRNLLKSDPGVDLVQFTILTNPSEKRTNASQRELSLIAFPTRQLFEEKLDEFDLIIFDQFQRRSARTRSGRSQPIIRPIYLQNVATYVENGGALLVAAGPAFAAQDSLYRSQLAAVLPARPTGETVEGGFSPKLNDAGRRHPITAAFSGEEDQSWGRWFRIIESSVISGDVLMEGPDAEPLLVIDKFGDGRTALLLSDQAWLWAKGFEGGGPYSEIFRRLAHWLMGEPDLDAEKLTAQTEGGKLLVQRRTLNDSPQSVVIQKPDGTAETLKLTQIEPGLYEGQTETAGQGAYRLTSGDISTVSAIGSLNPKEFSDLTPTAEILRPLIEATSGLAFTSGIEGRLPDIRRTKPSAKQNGQNWMGLVNHEQYVLRSSRRTPLAPGLLLFALLLLAIGWAWRREGR